MKILALDTALGACSAAVQIDRRVIAFDHQIQQRGHAETLAPMVQRVMREAGLRIPDLDRIAVTVGPGTFTGLRVGLAAARGFSVASDVGLVGVTTLDALAAGAAERLAADDTWRSIVAVIDARRGEVYRRTFRRVANPPGFEATGAAEVVALDQIASQLPEGPGLFVGTGARSAFDQLGDRQADFSCPDVPDQPDARNVAMLGCLGEPPVPGQAPAPLYLRKPDAKLPAARQAATSP
ncbi:MAG: tRNA (adenosine(37)-N6)-threonylcarbamoyltransferase complex dimerization subunit type 1 TsaB [Sphingomonadales bacterium]